MMSRSPLESTPECRGNDTAADRFHTVRRLGAVGMATAYRTGQLDPAEICRTLLSGARDDESTRNILLAVTHERAHREAAAASRRYRSGRPLSGLDGVPIVWKDLFDIAGTATTMGSPTQAGTPVAETDAPLVRTLTRAGLVCLGKANLSEFAFSGLGINPWSGTPLNPVDPALIPGGSSSGSAAAVARGLVPVAVGTDTSGSVRVPAACCGVIGYRASTDRYGTTGMWPLAPTLDSVGFLARYVRDIVAVDRILTRRRSSPPPARRLRVVVPEGELVDDCAGPVVAAFTRAISALERAGVTVRTQRLKALDQAQRLMDTHGTLVVAEAYDRFAPLLADSAPVTDPAVLRRLATFDPAKDGRSVLRGEMRDLRTRIGAELAGAVLAYPTLRDPVPELAPLLSDEKLYDETNRRVLRSTMLSSYLDMPGVTIPMDGHGVLLSSCSGTDADLLAAARTVEAILRSPKRE